MVRECANGVCAVHAGIPRRYATIARVRTAVRTGDTQSAMFAGFVELTGVPFEALITGITLRTYIAGIILRHRIHLIIQTSTRGTGMVGSSTEGYIAAWSTEASKRTVARIPGPRHTWGIRADTFVGARLVEGAYGTHHTLRT